MKIVKEVCKHFKLNEKEFPFKGKMYSVVKPRMFVSLFCAMYLPTSPAELKWLLDLDRSTIYYYINTLLDNIPYDPALKKDFVKIKAKLKLNTMPKDKIAEGFGTKIANKIWSLK